MILFQQQKLYSVEFVGKLIMNFEYIRIWNDSVVAPLNEHLLGWWKTMQNIVQDTGLRPEDGGSMALRNFVILPQHFAVSRLELSGELVLVVYSLMYKCACTRHIRVIGSRRVRCARNVARMG
jgi:hypothetical protein